MKPADDAGDGAPHLHFLEVVAALAKGQEHVRGVVAVSLANGENELEQLLLHLSGNVADHAEIDQCDAAIGRQQHVARMRVGVEHAVDQDLLQVRAEEILGQRRAVHLGPFDAADGRDLRSADVVHREHAGGREIVHGQRHDDVLEVAQLVCDGDQVAGLLAVIELRQQRVLEFLDDARRINVACGADPIDDRRDLVERREVLVDPFPDARPLHLDRHFAAAAQHGAVNLAQGGGGNRQAIELEERVRHAHAELLADGALDVLVGEGLDVVLQAGQRIEIRGRKQVGARREYLTQLDECRAERFQVADECFRGFAIG